MSCELKGSFGEIRRNIISKDDDDHRSCYMGMQGRLSLADLIDHLSVVAPGKSLDEIGINFATVKWVDDATDEEKRDRAERQRRADERHAQWERETYERLKVKFGSVSVLPEETPGGDR